MSPVKLKHLFLRSRTYYYVRRSGGKVVWRRLSRDLSEALRLWQALEAEAAPSASRAVGRMGRAKVIRFGRVTR